jgi:crossover junction endodeoxyribonuclease RusA
MIPGMIEFFVPGAPVPAGSKRAFPIRGRDGALHVGMADMGGRRGEDWRAAIRLAAAQTVQLTATEPFTGPLRLSLWFLLARPRSHRGNRGLLLPRAPTFPTTRPDVLKLARAVEDACTGIVWRDDAQIVDEDLHKLYADGGAPLGVRVRIAPLAGRAGAWWACDGADEQHATRPSKEEDHAG